MTFGDFKNFYKGAYMKLAEGDSSVVLYGNCDNMSVIMYHYSPLTDIYTVYLKERSF